MRLTATEPDLLRAILQLAAGGPEADLVQFFEQHTEQGSWISPLRP